MAAKSTPFRTIWLNPDRATVGILDQTLLPQKTRLVRLKTVEQAARAIFTMQVRGAPLIGVTAAYGVMLAMRQDASDAHLHKSVHLLAHTRPTAVNLQWALDEMLRVLEPLPSARRVAAATIRAEEIAQQEAGLAEAIGRHGLALLQALYRQKKTAGPLQIMTHCNAGKLATNGLGTATAPMYLAHAAGMPIHVWVSETRPRLQGALTAWELQQSGVPLTVMADNVAGPLLQRGLVDAVIVGADRITARGDVANKVGTYLKALAARTHGVPFYVAVAGNTIDWKLRDGLKEIPIEQRSAREVTHVRGVAIMPQGVAVRNDAFDVTPAELVTGFITERGVCRPAAFKKLFG
jgi:methylthioribose-1-phosphate isomerase